jgi:hypothetical protein
MIQDGGFELGMATSHWEQGSTNFVTPICNASCGGDGPRTGSYWAWFGGTLNAEQGFLEQQKKIAPGPKQLTFWLWWSDGDAATSTFKVKIDDDAIFALTGATSSAYRSGWTAVAIDISAYADGNVHTLRFEHSSQAGPPYTNIYLDDVNFGNLSGTPMPTATGTPTASPTATSTAGPGFDVMLPLVKQ